MSAVVDEVGDRVWDLADRRLVAALQCYARVSAERAGAVLGVAPRHVARRWAAMRAEGSVRLGVETAPRPGDPVVLWRFTPRPGAARSLLAALADDDGAGDVRASAAGDEVSLTRTGPSAPGPAPAGVAAARAAVVLHRYRVQDRLDVLTAEERRALTPTGASAEGSAPRRSAPRRSVPRGAPVGGAATGGAAGWGERAVDAHDAGIVAALRRDPRASAATVAAACGLPASTARRRLASLLGSGVLRLRVAPDGARLGAGAPAHLHLQLSPGRVDAAARALAAHACVREVLAVTGPAPLRVLVAARDVEHLHLLLTRDLPALTGDAITGAETVLLAP